MRKILYVITQGEMGGAQKYVYDLATRLPEDFEVSVAMGKGNRELGLRLKNKNPEIKVYYLRWLVRNIHPLKDLAALFEIIRLIRELRPDIVHLNSSKAGVLGSLAAGISRHKETVFTAHGLAFLEPNPWLIKKSYFWAEKLATRFRKKVITVSGFDREQAIKTKLGPANKFITIHNGIDLDDLNILPRDEARRFLISKLKIQNSKIIGTIANLYPTKGLGYLIDAARGINAKFVVIGEGKERKNLESKIQSLGLSDNFYLLGKLENAHQYLRAFDIFVLPSVKEGLPYIILEAAAAGLPIVATSVGGIPEILTNIRSGLLVAPKDSQSLTNAIKKLIADPRLAKTLGQQAAAVAKNFTVSQMLINTLTVYQAVMRK